MEYQLKMANSYLTNILIEKDKRKRYVLLAKLRSIIKDNPEKFDPPFWRTRKKLFFRNLVTETKEEIGVIVAEAEVRYKLEPWPPIRRSQLLIRQINLLLEKLEKDERFKELRKKLKAKYGKVPLTYIKGLIRDLKALRDNVSKHGFSEVLPKPLKNRVELLKTLVWNANHLLNEYCKDLELDTEIQFATFPEVKSSRSLAIIDELIKEYETTPYKFNVYLKEQLEKNTAIMTIDKISKTFYAEEKHRQNLPPRITKRWLKEEGTKHKIEYELHRSAYIKKELSYALNYLNNAQRELEVHELEKAKILANLAYRIFKKSRSTRLDVPLADLIRNWPINERECYIKLHEIANSLLKLLEEHRFSLGKEIGRPLRTRDKYGKDTLKPIYFHTWSPIDQ